MRIKAIVTDGIKIWDNFWFGSRSLLNLAIFRIILCLMMAFMYVDRLFDVQLFYSEYGMLPRANAISIITEFYQPPFEWFFWSDNFVFMAHLVLVVGLISLALGVGGRILNLIVWVLHIGFLHRNFSIAFGADLIGGIFLLYMIFTQSCSRLSLWRNSKELKAGGDLATRMFYRLIQIQLCIIYTYTGFEKLKGASWWDGTALWSVLANPQMVIVDLSWIRYISPFVLFISYGTILFEIYFVAFIWRETWRRYVLAIGTCFHLGIGFIMALYSFALIMLSPYVLFLREDETLSLLQKLPFRLGFRIRTTGSIQ
jgi:hypothetical protein